MACVECIESFLEFMIRASWHGILFSVTRLPGFCGVLGEREVRGLEARRSLSKF